ncbi:MAG: tRNA (adenosine(37)-N6)-threonylcarbamoyltransferase complex dimerization subunit type 1 TsaB [Candidatus Kerfeldbacteria bacterium]|nr:tRNA (adenosine(37)-N6)-threonylcarbamoyltransferase complex dimerization subunit type 1 TsaB [Candidatus Kerfeldbacteria bacterium]
MILGIDATEPDQLQLIIRKSETRMTRRTIHVGHRASENYISRIQKFLTSRNLHFSDLSGIIVRRGPGSFTALRVGVTIANTLAFGLGIAVVGSIGDDWLNEGFARIEHGRSDYVVEPLYQ